MRIIFVTYHLTNGGAEREVIAFANALARMGEEVCLAYIQDIGVDYTIDSRVQTFFWHYDSNVRIPKIKGLCNILMHIRLLRKLSGDVVISFNFSLGRNWRIWASTFFSRTKMVYAIINNVEKRYPEKKKRRQYERICRLADAIWIQTEEQRKLLPTGVKKKAFEVRNILDRKFLETTKIYRGEIIRFISVGRLHPQKNQELLVEAFAKMLERIGKSNITLTIYGRDKGYIYKTEERIKKLISKHHLEDCVFLPGWMKDIEDKYAQADAFVLSSDYEGFPNALMEAMASGLPCISTNCPTGPSELIKSGENGILVPVGDVEAMSRAMELLVNNPQGAEKMGKQARKTMRKWGTEREQAEQLLENLRRICL